MEFEWDEAKNRENVRKHDIDFRDDIRKAVAADPAAAPILDASWVAEARYVPPPKEAITTKLDRDLLAWCRQGGRGYQTRINAVLRAFMEHERRRR